MRCGVKMAPKRIDEEGGLRLLRCMSSHISPSLLWVSRSYPLLLLLSTRTVSTEPISSYLNIKGRVRGQHEVASASFLKIDPPHSAPAYCRRMSSFKEPVKCRRHLRAVDTK